jgi:hypothetical protein
VKLLEVEALAEGVEIPAVLIPAAHGWSAAAATNE